MPKKRRDRATQPTPDTLSSPTRATGAEWLTRLTAGVLILLGVIPAAKYISPDAVVSWWGGGLRTWLIWTSGLLILALLAGRFATRHVDAIASSIRRLLLRPSPTSFSALVALLTTAGCTIVAQRLFAMVPTAGDEMAQRFHAMVLQHGRLGALAPEPAEFFSTSETLMMNGSWFSQFPVGGPALLAVGAAMRAPWLVNPVLTAVAILAIYAFARRTASELTARVVAVLLMLSPFVMFMGGTQMNHPGSLAFIWIAFAALAHWSTAETSRARTVSAGVIGLAFGCAATIRPFDAFVAGIAAGVFQLFTPRDRGAVRNAIIIQFLVGSIPIALMLLANTRTLGAPLPFAYDVLNGPEHRPGFHQTPLGFPHTPRRGLYMISAYLLNMNVVLNAWPVPTVLLTAAGLAMLRRPSRWDVLLASLVVLFLVGYGAYWSESYLIGPRFLFVVAPIFILYLARLPFALRNVLREPWLRSSVAAFFMLCTVVGVAAPAQSSRTVGMLQLATVYRAQSGIPALLAAVERDHLANAVVLLPANWHERLAARLRVLGVRPLAAERLIMQFDACTMHQILDAGVAHQWTSEQTQRALADMVVRDLANTPPFVQQGSRDVVRLQGREFTPQCDIESRWRSPVIITVAEMLGYGSLDSTGAIGGPVIYARDLGALDQRLTARYGDRKWYRTTAERMGDSVHVTLTRIH